MPGSIRTSRAAPALLATCIALLAAAPYAHAGQDQSDGDESAPADTSATDERPDGDRSIEVRVSTLPEDARISLDGEQVATGNWAGRLSAGEHTFRIEREGYRTVIEDVVVDSSAPRTLVLRFHLQKLVRETLVVERNRGPIDRMTAARRNAFGWISTAFGASLLGTSIFLAAIDDNCRGGLDTCNRRNTVDTDVFTVLTATTGGVFLTGGIALLLWQKLAGDVTVRRKTVRLAPTVDARGRAGLMFGFTW